MNNAITDFTNSVHKISVSLLIIGIPALWLGWMNVHILGAETRWEVMQQLCVP
jgi:spore maturation protein SpmA